MKLKKFGSVHQCRWVASQLRALNALHQNYQATCEHFQAIAQEGSKDAAKVSGLLLRLRSPKFVTFLLFMRDFIQVITRLSQIFQGDDLLVIDVIPQIEATMLQLVEMQSNPGLSIASLTKGKVYKGIELSGEVEPEIAEIHNELITAAIDFMDKRFVNLQKPPLADFKVFNFTQWPYDRAQLVKYGVEEVQRLVEHFAPLLTEEEVDAALEEWLVFKLHVSNLRTTDLRTVYRDLLIQPPVTMKHFLPLIEIMLTHSMSTARVERGFSHMNIIKSSGRSQLRNDSFNNCMEVKINGPNLEEFQSDAAVLHWLNNGGYKHYNGHKLTNS